MSAAEQIDEAEAELELGQPILQEGADVAALLARRMGGAATGALEGVVSNLRQPPRDPGAQLEALLFSTSTPQTVAEIARALQVPDRLVPAALSALDRSLIERNTPVALFVREKQGQRAFILDLKTQYRADVAAVAPPLLKPAVTETLALIAMNQPLPQARLVRERGSTVYEHVKELMDRGLVARSRKGRSFFLRTTDAFAAEFGLDNDPELIRRALARAAGVNATPQVVGSPRVHFAPEGEAAEGVDPQARAQGLEAEAREFVPPPAPEPAPAPAAPKVMTVAEAIAAEAAAIEAAAQATIAAAAAVAGAAQALAPAPAPEQVTPLAQEAPQVAAPGEQGSEGQKKPRRRRAKAPEAVEAADVPPPSAAFPASRPGEDGDCVVSGGEANAFVPPAEAPVAAREVVVSESPNNHEKIEERIEPVREVGPSASQVAKVADLRSLFNDQSTSDDW